MESSRSRVAGPQTQPPRAQDDHAVGSMSPCVSICTLDERGVCRGCLRTVAEISNWLRMSAAQRRVVLARIEARRALAAGR